MREGEGARYGGIDFVFSVRLLNHSSFSKRVAVALRDGDEWVTEVPDILIRPGANEIVFPHTRYRFSRHDHCFTVLVDIDGSRRAVDLARRFCAERASRGWTLSGKW